MRNRRAFTLIELLLVVALISLLVSMLIPALSKVRERARLAVCLGNLRHITPAGYLYSEVNNGLWPIIPVLEVGNNIQFNSWHFGGKTSDNYWKNHYGGRNHHTILERPLNPFVLGGRVSPDTPERRTEMPIFKCPSDIGTFQRRFWYSDPPLDTSISSYDDVGTSYHMNVKWWHVGRRSAARWAKLRHLFGRVRNAGQFVWLYDQKMDFMAHTGYTREGDHGGVNKAVAAFLDGSARYLDVEPDAVSTPDYILAE